MTHAELKALERSDLQAAIACVRTAPVEFMMAVANDNGYSAQLRFEACSLHCRLSMVRRLVASRKANDRLAKTR